jgi:DNA-binding response OmpR family regulator
MTNNVLLVEDEKKTAEIFANALRSEGISVTQFSDGESALTDFKKGKYDLVILDLKLPGISGDEVLESIRKIDPYVEVIIYSNYQEPPVMKKLINLGVDGYINKGATADLWATVEKVKLILDPFSDEQRETLLASIPQGAFKQDKDN